MKKKKGKPKTGECVYCGRIGPVSDDHIPPKCLFEKRPGNLITVPSCIGDGKRRGCNNGASDDDEYFRMALSLRAEVDDHPEISDIKETVFRSLKKPNKIRFRDALLKGVREVELRSPAGLILGTTGSYDVDLFRLNRVATRIVQGLFYHHKGNRLPDGYTAMAFSTSGFYAASPEYLVQVREQWVNPLLKRPPITIGDDVFSYRMDFVKEDPNVSGWLLVFYQRIVFLGSTMPDSFVNEDLLRKTGRSQNLSSQKDQASPS